MTMGYIHSKLRDYPITATVLSAKSIKYLSLSSWLMILLIERCLVLCHSTHFSLLCVLILTQTVTMSQERVIHLTSAPELSCLQPMALLLLLTYTLLVSFQD